MDIIDSVCAPIKSINAMKKITKLILSLLFLLSMACESLALQESPLDFYTKKVSGLFHATFDRNKGFQTPFTRGEGRW
jgi:hypothetical protein